MKLSNAIWAIAVCCFLFLAFLARENSFAFQQCVVHQEAQSNQASIEKLSGIISRTLAIRCTGRLINKMNAVITALATLVISAFTIVLVLVTNRQARLTADSVVIAKDALLKTERAFIFIDGFNYELSTRADRKEPLEFFDGEPEWHKLYPELVITRFAIQPRWKNGGTTPTRNMRIQVDWKGPGGGVPPAEYSYRNAGRTFFLGPMAVEPGEVIDISTAAAIVNWSMRPIGSEPLILIWGRADYEDVFGKPHFVEWCYRLRLSRPVHNERMTAQLIQWGDYNRSDEG